MFEPLGLDCCLQASLETSIHVYRFKVVQSFMISGTPLHRLNYFRPLMETAGVALTDHSHLASTYIPLIEQREMSRLQHELRGAFIGIAFDGTSRLGEAVSITGRYCTASFALEKRLLRFLTCKLHLKAREFASLITRVLCTELSINPAMITCLSRDSVLVNGAACRILQEGVCYAAENQLCISHTLNNVGARIEFDVLKDFMTPWLELVGGRQPHCGAKALWRSAVHPTLVPGYSKVRWHSLAEIEFVLAENFDKLPGFLDSLNQRHYGEATREKLNGIMNSPSCDTLRLQLAGMLDIRMLVRTTYELEGERLEVLLVYNRIERLRHFGNMLRAPHHGDGVLPNVDMILRQRTNLRNGLKIKKVRRYPML